MITKDFLEKLTVDCGLAINQLNGRCGMAEQVLCRVTTLCAELLDARSDNGSATAIRPDDPTLSDIIDDLKHRGGGACIHVGFLTVSQQRFAVVAAIGSSAVKLEEFYEGSRSDRHFDVQYPTNSETN